MTGARLETLLMSLSCVLKEKLSKYVEGETFKLKIFEAFYFFRIAGFECFLMKSDEVLYL